MAVRVGILCPSCMTVRFIATSSHISLVSETKNSYSLECTCGRVSRFSKRDMRPYLVSNEVFTEGVARDGEYETVPDTAQGKAV